MCRRERKDRQPRNAPSLKEKEEGAIGRLDKIDIDVEGNTSDAVTVLKPTQYVLVGLKARLPQGVTIKN